MSIAPWGCHGSYTTKLHRREFCRDTCSHATGVLQKGGSLWQPHMLLFSRPNSGKSYVSAPAQPVSISPICRSSVLHALLALDSWVRALHWVGPGHPQSYCQLWDALCSKTVCLASPHPVRNQLLVKIIQTAKMWMPQR